MLRRWTLAVYFVPLICGLLSTSACRVFDDALLEEIEASTDLPSQRLAATCGTDDTMPTLVGSASKSTVALSSVSNYQDDPVGGTCVVKKSVRDEGDAFFEIDANAGQRWHFHLDPKNDDDLAL